MNERRDEQNGNGWHQEYRRREYDSFESMCLKCDLRKEINGKVSWKHLLIVIGLIGSIVGTALALTVPAAIHGVERIVDTSKETLVTVNGIDKKMAIIETKQQSILHRLGRHMQNDEGADP